MKKETLEMMQNFNFNNKEQENVLLKNEYARYDKMLSDMVSGEGMIGQNKYLVLWNKEEIEEWNNDYAVQEFLHNIILIGSDGADTAYGRNIEGDFIEVPFIGMDDDVVEIIGNTFDEFIMHLYIS